MCNLDKIKHEMKWACSAEGVQKDILIVVHNQLEYLKKCINSIILNTNNFNIYLWNNNSDEETKKYLESISSKNIKIYNSKKNIGFVIPNNKLIKNCKSDWIILLNSDTEVFKNWDLVLIGALLNNSEIAQTGFSGGILDKNGRGVIQNSGFDIDYICGYCFCINKKTYDQLGLFDQNIKFAYCEDSDFSMRIKKFGKKIYACYSKELVRHYGSKTSKNVFKNKNLIKYIEKNQKYIISKWKDFFINK